MYTFSPMLLKVQEPGDLTLTKLLAQELKWWRRYSTTYDFDGVAPVDVDMTPGTGGNPTIVETSLDFVQLDRRDV